MIPLVCALLIPAVTVMSGTKVVMLGTGTPRQDPDRSGPASAVVVNGTAYLVDCGPGIVRRAAAAFAKGIDALKPSRLKTVFVTHLHSDHTLGLPDLIFSPWVVGRTDPLEAYGPAGLKPMVKHLEEAYREDVDLRIHGLEHGNATGYLVHAHAIRPGEIYRDANVVVTAFLVKHGSWREAYGFKFVTADRTVVFSGDTCPAESVVEAATGADVLVHEAYEAAEAEPENRPGGEEWPHYMHTFHTSAKELGEIAAKSQPKLLVLYHVLRRGNSPDSLLIDEVRQGGYTGPVEVAKDLDVY